LQKLFVDAGEPDQYRDAVSRVQMQVRLYRLYVWWTAGRLARGEKIGPESSVNKLVWSTMDMRMHEIAIDLLGLVGITDEGDATQWIDGYYFSLAGPIYAGTNEIQRNIIGERVLGLPRG
jgi:alkylation response protein AidB-like acyl-CoA dehydrogenase